VLADIRRALNRGGNSPLEARPVLPDPSRSNDSISEIKSRCSQIRQELIGKFESELTRVGGRFYRAATGGAAYQFVRQIILDHKAKTLIACDTRLIDGVDLRRNVEEAGVRFVIESEDEFIKTAAEADLGVSGVDYALADTGTLVLVARKGCARSISLLPPVHIAVLKPEQLISGLNDLFPLLQSETADAAGDLSSAITFITGPSRTADIELTLVVGVHGPQELHVILVDN
jgi:L-lactate dehydrogenase complex protein LldG